MSSSSHQTRMDQTKEGLCAMSIAREEFCSNLLQTVLGALCLPSLCMVSVYPSFPVTRRSVLNLV
jgi:hypothetical protein